jgi:hypothetical protein
MVYSISGIDNSIARKQQCPVLMEVIELASIQDVI